ncbi:hypothetical protein V8B55DRAFT_1408929 [Mucor lusitanicus]|uniref:Stc1 domain-containing protein n=2 Tax=Mucor circinelloides f. lusitanicus TaxID=29924 RepID=A0A168J8W1_MUCCL|nr:hypothetical protein FB192DRAFT_1441061 [Mucor lusitanicus]OAD00896.1 hypothetical protein MUCCIDRAFT_112316 [Mucor lusitanicus CBS 277.49]
MTDKRPAGAYKSIVKSTYSNASAATSAQTGAPKSLRCVFCDKYKPLDDFSARMISRASYNPYAPSSFNAKKKVVSCKSCTAPSTTHLTCMVCSKKKPLDKFANIQRRNHGRARCKQCIEKRQNENVWSDNDITDSDDDY